MQLSEVCKFALKFHFNKIINLCYWSKYLTEKLGAENLMKVLVRIRGRSVCYRSIRARGSSEKSSSTRGELSVLANFLKAHIWKSWEDFRLAPKMFWPSSKKEKIQTVERIPSRACVWYWNVSFIRCVCCSFNKCSICRSWS